MAAVREHLAQINGPVVRGRLRTPASKVMAAVTADHAGIRLSR